MMEGPAQLNGDLPRQGLDHSVDSPEVFFSGTIYHLGQFFPEDFLSRLFVIEIKKLRQ
jgi:hypothetical protein